MAGLSHTNRLRDVFEEDAVRRLARRLVSVWAPFNERAFVDRIVARLPALSFVERSEVIADALGAHLPASFPEAVRVLVSALGPELPHPGVTVWESFIVMPQCSFVARHVADDFDLVARALYEMTKRFSAEFHLRALLEADYRRTLALLDEWCADPSPHVRRLVSEGTRARLPMARHLACVQQNPQPVVALLERLRNDESSYVRRSVANNLNDLAKDHPRLVLRTLRCWSGGASDRERWVIKRAVRTLVKRGDPAALRLIGCRVSPAVRVGALRVKPGRCGNGDCVRLAVTITSRSRTVERVRVDYVITRRERADLATSRVFTLREFTLAPGASHPLEVTHPLQSPRRVRLADGSYILRLRLNGQWRRSASFIIARS